ncbi:MAG: twin-arginine translocase TatA/TatE family subunit [Deltaproteobacteria bacterium CG_4_8_14_3_um_filter_51_11]|nr:twin-arginine translocase TatA/TatE family subunit [bacterium]NCP09351.1 twin-arginine translocase TatA/TatE family subunit [bacterium]OIP38290.1 MAG: hypothetical protein AUK25_12945 [Desulfobacteraceae bacterium CG2_30_51_40]PIP48285.1 MAG: twin-arginine translocase TatA/TatE family subunit [Deltaproteobacteria bacterium CG23_combo_of_CG06-09_8_20_14_all_51_20]PIX18587.1 MAG: twin-arginine translocase TatA/TatE family subunit [Deltaproteobacteria bacterium CG_4_8_14_3_um_filter_51_11]
MFGLGGSELAIIALLVLLVFGARRLPEIGKGLGGAIREFKNVKKEIKKESAPLPETQEKNTKPEGLKDSPSIESRMAGKLLEQVPGLKKAIKIKEKADQITKAIS